MSKVKQFLGLFQGLITSVLKCFDMYVGTNWHTQKEDVWQEVVRWVYASWGVSISGRGRTEEWMFLHYIQAPCFFLKKILLIFKQTSQLDKCLLCLLSIGVAKQTHSDTCLRYDTASTGCVYKSIG